MTTELSERQADERRRTLVEIARLDLTRHLTRAGTTHLERAAVRADLLELLAADLDRDCELARAEGESYAAIARAAHLTRQGARKRYGHLEVVG